MLNEPQTDPTALWKRRIRAPVILRTEFAARNPAYGLAVGNTSGTYQLHRWDRSSNTLMQLTDRPEGRISGSLSPDGRFVYYLDDEHGNETGHYVRIPIEGGAAEDVTPNLPAYSSWSFGFSRAGNLLGFTAALPDGFHIYALSITPTGDIGGPKGIYASRPIAYGPFLSHGGEIGVVAATERTGMLQFSLIAIDPSTGGRIGELWDGPDSDLVPISFSPLRGDTRLLANSDRTGVIRPLLWNPGSGERIDLQVGLLEGDITAVDWSADGKSILLCQFVRAVQQLYLYDLERHALTGLHHPGGTFSLDGTYFTPTGKIFAQWQNSIQPPRLIALDGKTGEQAGTVLFAGDAPPGHPWRSVTFNASDGQEIQGWLSIPEGEGPFPTILNTHGGPEAVTTELYAARNQLWVDHGFAFFTINYRGSTTFGRAFREKIWGHPGHWEVEDMVAARTWLVENGIAVPEQVFVEGWSYGGYLTLQALGTRPDLWAGGMAGVAVADWFSQYEDESEVMRGIDIATFGGTPEEMPEAYRTSSPITYAGQVQAPVLIIQGRNDTRCPGRQVELYEARMRELGKPIEVHWFNAGHQVGSVEQVIEHQELLLRFVYRVLAQPQA